VERQFHHAQTGPSVRRRADDRHVLGDIRDGRRRQFHHLHGDRQTQVHAHGYQLLPVQFGRVRSHTAGVRVAAGNVVHMVSVREKRCAVGLENFKTKKTTRTDDAAT